MRKRNYFTEEPVEETVVEPIPWEIGKEYPTHQDLYIWDDTGNNKMYFEELPDKVKSRAFSDEFGKAILNSGARITVDEVEKVGDIFWIKTDFGFICGKSPKITYVF